MVKLIIDAIIDNYERKLIASREELTRTSDELKSVIKRYEKADDANIDLLKQVTQLKRELASAQVDLGTAQSHVQAAVACIPVEAVPGFNAETLKALTDALFTVPSDDHIAALLNAIAAAEEK